MSGTPRQRGFAHGYLLAPQILDFFRFFTREATTNTTQAYNELIIPFIEPENGWYAYNQEYLDEIRGIIDGMSTSPHLERGLHVHELGRNFTSADLLYLNDYGAFPESSAAAKECSQFAFWGSSSAKGLIAGRNMDGENDFRKVTVSYFMAHAVETETQSQLVHFMWPGFVTVASGVNSQGTKSHTNKQLPGKHKSI